MGSPVQAFGDDGDALVFGFIDFLTNRFDFRDGFDRAVADADPADFTVGVDVDRMIFEGHGVERTDFDAFFAQGAGVFIDLDETHREPRESWCWVSR